MTDKNIRRVALLKTRRGPARRGLTESADGAAVGLVTQRVGAGVAETQVPAGQDERVPHVRQTHHALGAVVADLVVGDLRGRAFLRQLRRQRKTPSFFSTERRSPLTPGCCICSRSHRSPAAGSSRRPPAEEERIEEKRQPVSGREALMCPQKEKLQRRREEEEKQIFTTCFCFRGFTQ